MVTPTSTSRGGRTCPGDGVAAGEALLSVDGVTRRRGQRTVLDDVHLTVRRGQVHGLLGPNGAGKTTLLRLVLGLRMPDAGVVLTLGVDPSAGLPDGLAGFADRPRFYPYLTGRRNLQLLGAYDGGVEAARLQAAVDRTGLAERVDTRVGGWSTGMRQRLALAAALLRRPRLLVLDEPATGLDPAGLRELHRVISELAAAGAGVLLSSHDMAEVDLLCDHVTILRAGRVARTGQLDVLRAEAPPATTRLQTGDDAAAGSLGRQRGLDLSPHPRGGWLLRAGQEQLDAFVAELAHAGVAVRQLSTETSRLSALYWEVTGEPEVPAVPEPRTGAA